MSKSLVELTADIITAQARTMQLSTDVMTDTVRKVFEMLQAVDRSEHGETLKHTTPRDPEASIQQHQVICKECGRAFTLLSNRHLVLHGLTPREYKKKHGIRLAQPLSARSLTAHRRRLAKDLGMGKHLAAWRSEQKRQVV